MVVQKSSSMKLAIYFITKPQIGLDFFTEHNPTLTVPTTKPGKTFKVLISVKIIHAHSLKNQTQLVLYNFLRQKAVSS